MSPVLQTVTVPSGVNDYYVCVQEVAREGSGKRNVPAQYARSTRTAEIMGACILWQMNRALVPVSVAEPAGNKIMVIDRA